MQSFEKKKLICAQDTITTRSSVAEVYGYTILIGAGTGSFLQAGFAVTQASVSPEEVTDTIGFMGLGAPTAFLGNVFLCKSF